MLCSLNPSTQYNGLDEHSKDISRKMHVLYVCGFQLVSITDWCCNWHSIGQSITLLPKGKQHSTHYQSMEAFVPPTCRAAMFKPRAKHNYIEQLAASMQNTHSIKQTSQHTSIRTYINTHTYTHTHTGWNVFQMNGSAWHFLCRERSSRWNPLLHSTNPALRTQVPLRQERLFPLSKLSFFPQQRPPLHFR